MDAKQAISVLEDFIWEIEHDQCVIEDYRDLLGQIANLLCDKKSIHKKEHPTLKPCQEKIKMKWIPVKDQKPEVDKVVLLGRFYQYGFPDSVEYAVGYLDEKGLFKPDKEGLDIPTYADVYLGFDPTHWAVIDSPFSD